MFHVPPRACGIMCTDMSCTVTVLLYICKFDCRGEETIQMDGIRIAGVAIHDFVNISEMCTTTHRRYYAQLQHNDRCGA